MKVDVALRVLGSGLVITAYFIILHIDTNTGVLINVTGDLISVPYFIRTRSWDVVVMMFFLLCISTSKLLVI
jgi:hypothetical protein